MLTLTVILQAFVPMVTCAMCISNHYAAAPESAHER